MSPATNSPPVLRPATINDLAALLVLISEFCAIDGHTFDKQRIKSTLPTLLETEAHNTRVRRFYERAGLQEDDCVSMSLRLHDLKH